ncbi:flagellar hook-basal body complex protein FliE [Couchioplanes caeruleus]|uniref:flagellar hook-basal body complex protein FliE n=1 Tax=Couchioplanes caeruleus TaxID=56438 RepID=UPI00201BAE2B|nr:flagellar hook-basal body complex protein FliE [Couchioplanes caeruleus]UQU65426.1 flagellar hook-basal body complex protein FliE [Couchioplanes caeruleus]
MTSPIGAIGAVTGLSGVTGVNAVSGTSGTAAATGVNTDFASMLSKGLESVQASQSNAGDLAVQVANGTLQDPAQYTMAATEASLGLQLTMAIRNKAVEAFQEIMRMQA